MHFKASSPIAVTLMMLAQPVLADHLPRGDAANGEELYNGTCVACHGEDGKGAFDGIPDLTGKEGRLAKPDDILFNHMRDGFQSEGSFMAMPPKGGNPDFSDQDLVDLLAYLKTRFAVK